MISETQVSQLALNVREYTQLLRLVPGVVATTLNVFNPAGASYGVQFSTDGVTWSTLATNQTGRVWKGIRPSSPQGYYRLLKR